MNPYKNAVRTHLDCTIEIEFPTDYNLQGGGTLTGSVPIGKARLQSLSASHDYGAQPVHGIGDYEPAEFVHLKFAGSLTLETFMIRKRDLVGLGVAALGKAILAAGVLSLKIKDLETGELLRVYSGCVIGSYEETFREGQICGENARLMFQTVKHGDGLYATTEVLDPSSPKDLLPRTALRPEQYGEVGATSVG
jgi:hypothetical protein